MWNLYSPEYHRTMQEKHKPESMCVSTYFEIVRCSLVRTKVQFLPLTSMPFSQLNYVEEGHGCRLPHKKGEIPKPYGKHNQFSVLVEISDNEPKTYGARTQAALLIAKPLIDLYITEKKAKKKQKK